MPGLVPGIHVFLLGQDVDGRDKPGHDAENFMRILQIAIFVLMTIPAHAFDLQGHRGARGLAPENTLTGFHKALRLGVDTLELDLAMTRDNVLVVTHDSALNPDIVRWPDGEWLNATGPAIRSLTLDEVKRFDVGRLKPDSRYAKMFPDQEAADGERIPTLKEVVDLARAIRPEARAIFAVANWAERATLPR